MSTYTVQKQLFSALGIKTITAKAIAKLSALALFAAFIVSCIGTSNVPVIYHVPTEGETYKITLVKFQLNDYEFPIEVDGGTDGDGGNWALSTFLPSVEFPNGLPPKSEVVIRINGADVTNDFNAWGTGGMPNHARVTVAINAVNTPLIFAALRDGRNTFQVLKPSKALVTFYMDMPGAMVHFTDVDDGWNGDQATAKRGNILVNGYLEGEDYSTITSMQVQVFNVDGSGNVVAIAGNGTNMTATPGTTTTQGSFFLALGANQPNVTQRSSILGHFDDKLRVHANYPFTSNFNSTTPRGLHFTTGSGGTITAQGLQLTTASTRSTASSNALNNDNYEIEFDIRYDAAWDGSWRKIFGYGPGGLADSRSPGIWKYYNANRMHWRHHPNNTGLAEGFVYTVGQFYSVKGVKRGSKFNLYVNGDLVDEGTVSSPKTAGDSPMYLGGAPVTIRNLKISSDAPIPAPANYFYSIVPDGWQTVTGAGIVGNGSAFGNPNAPQGTQAAFIQMTGSMSRLFKIRDNDEYTLRLRAAQRPNQQQSIEIWINGVLKQTVTPPVSATPVYTLYQIPLGVLPKGTNTIEFKGTRGDADHTAFLDEIELWKKPGGAYSFSFNAFDGATAAVVRVTVCDTQSPPCYTKQWLRSNVPLYDSRLKNNGAFSIAFNQASLKSTAQAIANIINSTTMVDEKILNEDGSTQLDVNELYFRDSTVDLRTDVSKNNSSTSTVLSVDAILNLYLRSTERVSGLNCRVESDYDQTRYRSDIRLSVNKTNYKAQIVDENVNLELGVSLHGGSWGLCGAADWFLGSFEGTIAGVINDVITGIFNNDLPRLRLAITIGDRADPLLGTYYMSLLPQMSDFFGLRNSWVGTPTDWDVRFGLNLGMHMKGQGANRIPALGSIYTNYIMDTAILSYGATNAERAANQRTMGATLTENWINQLFLGLWESGILYLDFNFTGVPENLDVYMDNVVFQFASAQPWEFDILPQADPKGDVLLTIPDLTIALIADIHYPNEPEYTFAYMLADVQLYLDLEIAPGSGALRLRSASTIEVTVKSIYSDWDGTTEDQMVAVFDSVLTSLTGSGAWDIPFPEILESRVEFGDVWSDNGQMAVTIDVYNPYMFPRGPRKPSSSTSIFRVQSLAAIGSNVTLPDKWYGRLVSLHDQVDNKPVARPGGEDIFRVSTSGARSQTRDCTRNDWYGWCDRWTNYYWTQAAYEWGFRYDLTNAMPMKRIGVDRRNDQPSKINNAVIRLRNAANTVVWTSPVISGTTDKHWFDIPAEHHNTAIKRIEIYVPPNTSHQYYSAPNQSNPGSTVNNGIGYVGDGTRLMSFTEVLYEITP